MIFSIREIDARTSPVTMARGLAYAESGKVLAMALHGNRLVGCVQGESLYAVSVRRGDGDGPLDLVCSCPASARGRPPCKHVCALLFAWAKKEGGSNGVDG